MAYGAPGSNEYPRIWAFTILTPLRDTLLGHEVALKVLPPQVAGDPVRLARFEREAKTLAALDHPGIVTFASA